MSTLETEAGFMRAVTDMAERFGWLWLHIPTSQTVRKDATSTFRTAASGPLAKGWPDLVLVRERDRRLIFAELKSETGKMSPEQKLVLEAIAAGQSGRQVFVWHPSDWPEIEATLR